MRTHGRLKTWNEERGFGFISPAHGSEDIFVHISAFPRDGVRPRVNELISFETEAGAKGKTQAVRVMRPPETAKPRHFGNHRPDQTSSRSKSSLIVIMLIAAIGTYGYSRLNTYAQVGNFSPSAAPTISTPNFSCDGRTMCSQMSSCAEATYFLQHCPNTKMDGNNDGEPCEQQWCH